MPPDYSGQNLRGRSFKGQNLEGANFSHADIRSTNFTGANLRGANFTGAKAGLQKRWVLLLVLLSWLMSGISNCLLVSSKLLIAYALASFQPPEAQLGGWVGLIITIIVYIIIIRQGMSVSLYGTAIFAVALGFAVALVFALATGVNFPRTQANFAAAVALAFTFAVAFAFVFAFIRAFAAAAAFVITFAFAVAAIGLEAAAFVVITFAFTVALAGGGAFFIAFTVAFTVAFGAGTVVSAYVAWRSLKGDEKYALVRSTAVAFAAIGGTSFRGADLTDANFTDARLKSTDLRNAKLIRTCFHKTKLIDRIRPGISYLQHSQVRQLMLTGQGEDKNFDRLDLRGINLKNALLTDVSFIGTDLSEACLQDADLSRAKLVQTQLDQTDFTGATLTGAYIEDWNITHETNFRNVRCEYVYMRFPTKENPNPLRKPDNNAEIFTDGDFADFIQPIFDTLDLYHNQGVDPRAMAAAFKEIAEKNPNAELEIVAIERRGEDKILIRAKTAISANKSELSKEYFINYNQLKELAEKDFKALIAQRDNSIRRLENMIATALERPSFYLKQGDTIRNINMDTGNYNEGIEGDYNQNSGISQSMSGGTMHGGMQAAGDNNSQQMENNVNQADDK